MELFHTEPYYQDDYVTLYHGDCLEHPEWWTGADVLVTDPPYGIGWEGVANYSRGMRTDRKTVGNLNPIAGDESLQVRDRAIGMWGGRKPSIIFGKWSMPRPQNTAHRLIWWKRGQAPGPATAAFMTQDEEIYISGDGFVKSTPPLRSVIVTSEARSMEVQKIGHPTPKPIGLMEILIGRCQPSWMIADPFAGSGSTLVAAKGLQRKAVGVELEERYCEIAARRLSQEVLDLAGVS